MAAARSRRRSRRRSSQGASCAPAGSVEAFPEREARMAIGTGKIPPAPAPVKWHRRRRLIWAGGALAFLVLAVFYVLAATDPTDNIALSRNDVVAAEGG